MAEVARDFGVSWDTAMNVVRALGTPLVEDPSRIGEVAALGIDESSFRAGSATSRTEYVTGFVDLDRRLLLDITEDGKGDVVRGWLGSFDADWLRRIAAVAIDPHRGYKGGLHPLLDHATVVVDPFHAIRLGNAHLDDTRRRVQQDVHGHRGHKGDPLYGVRRLLLVAHERLSGWGWSRIRAALDHPRGDPFDEVWSAYLAKEMLREVYAAKDRHQAHRRLMAFYWWCVDAGVPELLSLAREVSRWEEEVLAYHDTRLSNAPTEAINLLIKKVKRLAHGFRNFANYRLRLLLHCGGCKWETRRTERLRGRSPGAVA